jgi:hypothetical protein
MSVSVNEQKSNRNARRYLSFGNPHPKIDRNFELIQRRKHLSSQLGCRYGGPDILSVRMDRLGDPPGCRLMRWLKKYPLGRANELLWLASSIGQQANDDRVHRGQEFGVAPMQFGNGAKYGRSDGPRTAPKVGEQLLKNEFSGLF